MKIVAMENNTNTPMLHAALVYQIKKSRGINWTPSEKEYLLQLCSQRVGVIENKKSDLITLSKKAAAWKFIHSKFSARFGRKRTPIRIKEQWKRMKIAARAELRDRGVKPEAGAAPVDPNIVTNKYYGENIDIISKVQEILFCKNLIKISENNDIVNGNDAMDGLEVPFMIKTEPTDESSEIVFEYSDPHGDSTSSFASDNSFQHDEAHMYVCSKQNEEGTENPYSHMSHISGGTPYSNNFVTEQYIGSNTVTPMSRVTQERHVTSPIQSKDQPGIRSINRSATSQESRNGTNEDEHELQQYSHANGISKESKTVEDKLLEYARIEHARKMQLLEEEHHLQMEILTIQRDRAAAKLKKANFKLNACKSSFHK